MPCTRKFDCIQKALEDAFYKYGKFVSRHPLPFLIVPVIISCGLVLGMINFNKVDDTEYLYTPTNGPAKDERKLIRNIFPENDTYYFNPTRKSNRDGFILAIITDLNGGNVYTETILNKAIMLDTEIKAIRSKTGNQSYSDICANWKGECSENPLLTILNGTGSAINYINLTFPLHNSFYFLGFQLGGVVVDTNDNVLSAKALYLGYYVRYLSASDITVSDQWLQTALEFLSTYSSAGVTIDYQSSLSLTQELDASVSGIIPRFAVTYSVLMTFCCLTCVMLDWVRSKPWFALGGEIAAGMAIITSLGMLSAAGVLFSSTVGTMPFLVIGIGIDDMFVILSAWRHTSVTLSVEERVGLTYKTAAISITLTSVTDALAFLIGSITTFRSVTLFCAYTGVAVVFSYIYAITFLAAVLTYSGEREAANRHEMTCMKAIPKEKAVSDGRSKAYQIFCTGGYQPSVKQEDPDGEEEQKIFLPSMTIFIREKMAPFLMKVPVKITVLVLYCIYLSFAIWGCVSLKEGLQLRNLAPDGSYLIPFFDKENQYFTSKYGPKVMVAFTDTLDYSDITVRNEVTAEIDTFRNNSLYYSDSIYLESWLSSYLSYLSATSKPVPTNMTSFIDILRNQFLTIYPYDKFTSDLTFNADYTQITASRVLVQSLGVQSTLDERKLMVDSRKLAEDAKYSITVYHPGFIYFDQFTVIVSNTLQNLGIAVACMLLVSLVLLPSLISVLWVTLSVVSICTGVVGYMVFWDVSLDSVSMINLIMCIGFSVDFSAHISYHFSISKEKTGNERAIDSLGHLGTPIIQGAISTILGAVVLSTAGSYIFRTFFKIMFLVMVFGFAHAMFILPVILSVIGPQSCCNNENEVSDITTKKEQEIKCVAQNGDLTPVENNLERKP